MGQAFSEPVTEKESSTEKNDKFIVASSSIQGWRISMEDAHTILLSMPDDPEASFFAIFDGHGGAKVANYASENLHQGLCSHRLYREGQIEEALKNTFIEFDEMMFNNEKMRDELAGSTAVVILIKDHQIYCANIGDSRAVASFNGKVDALSIDHKPTCEDEMNRIISAGGWVQFNRVNGNLALSRAFGDFVFKRNEKRSATEQIVIAYPDVQTRPLTSDFEFTIMACDGVWDVMTNEEVIEFIRRRIFYRREPIAICEELITRCLAPDCQMGCGIGCDNMTVILICYLNGSTYDEFCDRISNIYSQTITGNIICSSTNHNHNDDAIDNDQTTRHIIGPITHVSDFDAYDHVSHDANHDDDDSDDDDNDDDDNDDDDNSSHSSISSVDNIGTLVNIVVSNNKTTNSTNTTATSKSIVCVDIDSSTTTTQTTSIHSPKLSVLSIDDHRPNQQQQQTIVNKSSHLMNPTTTLISDDTNSDNNDGNHIKHHSATTSLSSSPNSSSNLNYKIDHKPSSSLHHHHPQ